MEILKKLNKTLVFPLVVILWIYQHTLSPDHGPLRVLFPYGYCKFYPSCSSYSITMLRKYGFWAIPSIIKRVFACTPNSLGGVDMPR